MDGGDDLVGHAHLLASTEQIAEPFRGAHEFRRDDEHETRPQPRAQRGEGPRQDQRQQDAPGHLRTREPEGAPDFESFAVDGEMALPHAEIDRKNTADGNQAMTLEVLEDAEPENEQGAPSDRGPPAAQACRVGSSSVRRNRSPPREPRRKYVGDGTQRETAGTRPECRPDMAPEIAVERGVRGRALSDVRLGWRISRPSARPKLTAASQLIGEPPAAGSTPSANWSLNQCLRGMHAGSGLRSAHPQPVAAGWCEPCRRHRSRHGCLLPVL